MLNLDGNHLQTRSVMERALLAAGQFVHIPEIVITNFLDALYDPSTNSIMNPRGNYLVSMRGKGSAVSDHLVSLHADEVVEQFFAPFETCAALASIGQRTCGLCYHADFYSFQRDHMKRHYNKCIVFNHTLHVSVSGESHPAPIPLCDQCHNSMSQHINRKIKAGDMPVQHKNTEIAWTEAMAWILTTWRFRDRIGQSEAYRARHRFDLRTP